VQRCAREKLVALGISSIPRSAAIVDSRIVIEVEDLSFTYAGAARAAVSGLSFMVKPGEVFGFLGPSGAGKSTTQKILIGLVRGYRGSARLLGTEVSAWRSNLYERIGVSFEFPTLYLKLTGLENLKYFGRLFGKRTREPRELLESVGLEHSRDMRVGQYSKGMKTRLGVARALLHDPELLFMDEPTAGLDPFNARLIRVLIKAQSDAGKTVFLTTHDMATVDELCDRAAFIVDGQISLIDGTDTLKRSYGSPTLRVEYLVDGKPSAAEFPLEGLGANADFQKLLFHHEIQTLHSQEATLESVFIKVTGRKLT
jgi:fluoroquinolone transport system ATP-binding protein